MGAGGFLALAVRLLLKPCTANRCLRCYYRQGDQAAARITVDLVTELHAFLRAYAQERDEAGAARQGRG